MHHDLGGLEPGHPLGGEPSAALVHVDPRAADHEGGHPLAQAAVGTAHHHGLTDLGVPLEDPLDLGGGDVLAPSDDQLLQPTDDGQPPLAVEGAEVAGGEPAPADGLVGLGLAPRSRRTARVPGPGPRPRSPAASTRSVAGSTTRITASPTECPSVSRARSGPSCQVLVVTVGASVDP